MAYNENLFQLLRTLRAELNPVNSYETQFGKLEELLEDIQKAVQGIRYPDEGEHVPELLEGALKGIAYAIKARQRGRCREAALVAKSTLTNLLADEELFR